MYIFYSSPRFQRKAKKLLKKNISFRKKLNIVIEVLQKALFSPVLQTHKVIDIDGLPAFSSRIAGDIRIIWDFNDEEVNVIDLIDIGGHSGKKKVYK